MGVGLSVVKNRQQELAIFTREIRRLTHLLENGHSVDDTAVTLLLYGLQDLIKAIDEEYIGDN